MNKIFNSIKNFLNKNKVGIEIKSAIMTFSAIFAGMVLVSPLVNSLIHTDLPTIQNLKDLGPVLLDTFYRALWITVLTESGLYKYRNNTIIENETKPDNSQ